jgi:hypothetical protein
MTEFGERPNYRGARSISQRKNFLHRKRLHGADAGVEGNVNVGSARNALRAKTNRWLRNILILNKQPGRLFMLKVKSRVIRYVPSRSSHGRHPLSF